MKRMFFSHGWWRLSVCGLSLSLAAGCGGGSSEGGGTGGGGGNPTTVTFTVRDATPTAVAAKIGSGAWSAQTLNSGKLMLSIPSGTTNFAVAYACPPLSLPAVGLLSGTSTRQTVLQASTADGTSFSLACAKTPSTGQTGTLTGSVDASAIPTFSYVGVEAANADSIAGTPLAGAKADFSFAAPAGNDRVEVLAYLDGPVGALPTSTALVAVKTLDNQQVPGALNGGNPVVLTGADQTTTQAITYLNVPAGFAAPSINVLFNMAGKSGFIVASGTGNSYPALPAAAVENGDAYLFVATAFQTSVAGIGLGQAVAASATTSTGGPMTFTFPAPWSYAGPAATALPTFDFTYPGFSGTTGLQDVASLTWLTGASPALDENTFTVMTTGNYLNGSEQVTFPDLTSFSGFLPAPGSGTSITWSAEIAKYSYPYGQKAPSGSTGSLVLTGGGYSVP